MLCFPIKPFLKSKGQSDPERERIKELGFRDYSFFIREFFPHLYWGDFSPLAREICEIERNPDRRGTREVWAAPRGNAKTTLAILIKAIHAIVYGYQPFILVLGYSKAEATDKVTDIRNELLTNERLIEVFGKLVADKAGAQDFETHNGCRVLARGRGGQVRGLRFGQYRPTLILNDDVEDQEGVATEAQRKKTENWFKKDVLPAIQKGGEYKGCMIFVGTILHEYGLLADLLSKPGWDRRKYKSIISWSERQDLWDKWKAIYCDLDNPNALKDARAFFDHNETEMLRGTKVLWPEGEPYYNLMEEYINLGAAAFSSEKQNEPYDPDSQILDPDKAFKFSVYWPSDEEWPASLKDEAFALVRHDNGKAIRGSELNIVAYLDPALGKDASSDYAALVVVGQDKSGYLYVLDCWLKKQPVTQQIAAAFRLYEKWGFKLHVETVGFQELLKPLFKEAETVHGVRLPIKSVKVHKNKEARIQTLESYFSAGWIGLSNTLNPELITQIRLFPTVHDDGPDALQGAVSQLRKPRGQATTINKAGGLH